MWYSIYGTKPKQPWYSLFNGTATQFGEIAKPHSCMDDQKRPTLVLRRLILIHIVPGKPILTGLVVVDLLDQFLKIRARTNCVESPYCLDHLGTKPEVQNSEGVVKNWPDVKSQVQGSLARYEKCSVIRNHSCCTKKSPLDQFCGVTRQEECCAFCSVRREGTASGAKEG